MSVIDKSKMIARDPLIEGYTIDELKVGDTAYYQKTITAHDVATFAGITGDSNPIHINKEAAKAAGLPGCVVHGALTAGLVSTVFGTKLPGQGNLFLKQESKFLKMVMIDDTLTAKAEITAIDKVKNRIIFKTEVYNQKDELVLVGESVIVPKK